MSAIVKAYLESSLPTGRSEVTNLDYDIWSLRVTVKVEGFVGVVYLSFDSPSGFRVLDECDLSELWKAKGYSSDTCLHVVSTGGWLDLEKTRTAFVTSTDECNEYLVSGVNFCVSVVASEPPEIQISRT